MPARPFTLASQQPRTCSAAEALRKAQAERDEAAMKLAKQMRDMQAGIEKERKKATSERMAMALVMERLAELRNSFDENSESDYELKMRVAQVR